MLQNAAGLPRYTGLGHTLSIGAVAGLAGGAAEILWITIYRNLSVGNAAEVARGVTETLSPTLGAGPAAVPLGIAIHMALAIALGVAIAVIVPRLLPRASAVIQALAVVAALIGVWALNFLVVLPLINPDFVTVVPYGTSLVSKVLFGVAAALVLRVSAGYRKSGGR